MVNHNHTANGVEGRRQNRNLLITLTILLVIMTAELIGGIFSRSLALIGDAGHMLVDALALSISLFALNLARRPATTKRTYGYHRIEIMAALINGIILTLVAAYIFYEAYQRLNNPPEVRSGLMLAVAVLGLAANMAGIMLLHRDRRANLNIRGAFLHVLGDTISSVGVIIGAIIISVTGNSTADPIIAIIIGVIILWGAFRLVRESSDILMETVPGHIQPEKVASEMVAAEGVQSIHDLHIWTITSGIYALSSHIVVDDILVSHTSEIVSGLNKMLAERFNITHTTLQLECANGQCAEGLVCQLSRPDHEIVSESDHEP